jgi:hypothetical protein
MMAATASTKSDATKLPAAASAKPDAIEPQAAAPSKPGARTTGTLSISSSSRPSAHMRKAPEGGLSVALDPALVAEAQNLDAPKPRSTLTPGQGSPATSAKKSKAHQSTEVALPPAHQASGKSEPQPSKSGSRISGAFSAIESDFFAREADLYKSEGGDDTFADLDEPAGRGGAKPPNGRRRSKR